MRSAEPLPKRLFALHTPRGHRLVVLTRGIAYTSPTPSLWDRRREDVRSKTISNAFRWLPIIVITKVIIKNRISFIARPLLFPFEHAFIFVCFNAVFYVVFR
mmetsp:Transcript_30893/g.95589  ORF Transcript_30893/g.95589 Transcript_30893/m.95589 type:complete len:102 (-) Transcript_30893:2767-3072(-)